MYKFALVTNWLGTLIITATISYAVFISRYHFIILQILPTGSYPQPKTVFLFGKTFVLAKIQKPLNLFSVKIEYFQSESLRLQLSINNKLHLTSIKNNSLDYVNYGIIVWSINRRFFV